MKRRQPATVWGYIGLGAFRGALAGLVCGFGLADLVLVSTFGETDGLLAIGAFGAIVGFVVGTVAGVVIGAVVGAMRDRLGAIAPAVAAITFGLGTIVAIAVAISNIIGSTPSRAGYAFVISLGISAPIAAIAGFAAIGVYGHASVDRSTTQELRPSGLT